MSSSVGEVGLAPMEGITDFATRLWFAKTSRPDFCWTPFYRATASSVGLFPREYAPELFLLKSYIPYKLIPQVMTGVIEQFCVMAETILTTSDVVDLNCGCPSPKVVGRGSGSSLLESTEKFAALISGISSRIGARNLTVKMRLGFYESQEIFALLKSIESLQLCRVTVHGRTRPQKYTGNADWELIHQAARSVIFPIIGSGDIYSFAKYTESKRAAPQVKTRIIGRGAVRNPWIFEELRQDKPIEINSKSLVYAISSFAVLQELQKNNLEALFSFVKEGLFLEPCGTIEENWIKFFSKISPQISQPKNLVLSTYGLARVKMLWNHMRTSLPAAFWAPEPLRTKSFSEFLECLDVMIKSMELNILLAHKPEWNWLFSGEKNPKN